MEIKITEHVICRQEAFYLKGRNFGGKKIWPIWRFDKNPPN